jgi:UDP-3-O-[3-hydroxymyristoyl] glucosamine N-acyltransferase
VEVTLESLAEQLGAEIANPPTGALAITGLASLRDAGASDLSFYHHDRYLDDLKATAAGAVLVSSKFASDEVTHVPLLKVESPSLAFDQVCRDLLAADVVQPESGNHCSAQIWEDAEYDHSKVSVGANAVIGRGCKIGDGTVVGPGAVIGNNVKVGAGCQINPNVTLYDKTQLGDRVILHAGCVIGADGFGFELRDGAHKKIEHFGFVQIDNDVEIGANSTIDRGRFGRTWIGEGTKIDNLCQIGHNAVIGKHCIIVADTAIAGSATVGDYVTMAAQVGLAGHIEVGAFSVLVARSGVTKSLPAGTPENPAYYAGFPAAPAAKNSKELVALRKLPDLLRRVKELEKRLDE